MNFLYRPLDVAAHFAKLTGKKLKLLPPELYAFDPEKVDHKYSFLKNGGDYTDLLTSLGFDHDAFSDAYEKAHGKEKPLLEVGLDNACILQSKNCIYLDEHAYYLAFLDQVFAHYDYRCEWKAAAPLAKLVKRFCKELKKCKFHYHYDSDVLLATIEDKNAFHFTKYLRQFFFGLWV